MTIRKKNEIKGIQIRKEEGKLPLFADGMILYIENPKDTIKKLLELISEFSSCRIQNQYTQIKWIHFFNNKKKEREMKESIRFTIATKRIKYLGITYQRRQ